METIVRRYPELAGVEQIPLLRAGEEHRPIRGVHQVASDQPSIQQFEELDAALHGDVQGEQRALQGWVENQ